LLRFTPLRSANFKLAALIQHETIDGSFLRNYNINNNHDTALLTKQGNRQFPLWQKTNKGVLQLRRQKNRKKNRTSATAVAPDKMKSLSV